MNFLRLSQLVALLKMPSMKLPKLFNAADTVSADTDMKAFSSRPKDSIV